MRTLKLTLQYDGPGFVGWQRQPTGASIQGLLEDALAPIEGGRVTVHGAGRTDAGVHALGQAASVTVVNALDERTLARALNAVLPLDVRVLAIEEADPISMPVRRPGQDLRVPVRECADSPRHPPALRVAHPPAVDHRGDAPAAGR